MAPEQIAAVGERVKAMIAAAAARARAAPEPDPARVRSMMFSEVEAW
jgi:TPP-dependent pyruvate/acetoin dehydrogenase alpha subunit